MAKGWIGVVIGLAGVWLAAAAPLSAAPPNIIYILADDLGYGDIGCYGQQKIQSPHLDRLAAEGMRFTQHYAGSTVCAPSRCVLMTGKHLGHAYIRGNAKSNLRPEDVTVAEMLKAAGYRTALVGKWGLGHEGSTGVPNRQGFDYFFGYLDQHHAHNHYPAFLHRNEQRVPLKNVVPPGKGGPFGSGVAKKKVEYAQDLFTAESLQFIEQNRDQPFFLYFASVIPHANNEAGAEGMETPDLGAYADKDWPLPEKRKAAMISRLDASVGEILAKVKKLGLDENTLVIFASDNGPHQEGGNKPNFFNSSGPLNGLKRSLTDGGIRVPMIARWPGHIAPGIVTDHVSYFGDVMATLADVAGTTPPSDLDSLSFAPTLLGRPEQQKQHDALYWEFYEGPSRQAVRMGPWKAIREPMLTGKIVLYNLEEDLGEKHNVADQHPEIVAQAAAKMDAARTPLPAWKAPAERKKP